MTWGIGKIVVVGLLGGVIGGSVAASDGRRVSPEFERASSDSEAIMRKMKDCVDGIERYMSPESRLTPETRTRYVGKQLKNLRTYFERLERRHCVFRELERQKEGLGRERAVDKSLSPVSPASAVPAAGSPQGPRVMDWGNISAVPRVAYNDPRLKDRKITSNTLKRIRAEDGQPSAPFDGRSDLP